MKRFLFIFMLIANPAFAENWICYSPDSTPANQITKRVNGDCKALGLCTGTNNQGLQANCFEATAAEFTDAAFPLKKINSGAASGSRVIDWTAQEIADKESQDNVNNDLAMRSDAKSKFDGQNVDAQALRCSGDIVRKEINILRQWTLDFKAEAAAATNLANFQSRIATLPSLGPDDEQRTLSQLKTAMQQCIDDGDVDE